MEEDTLNFLKELSKSCSYGSIHGNDCLIKVYKTVLSMLECRGYQTINTNCSTVHDIFKHMKNDQPIVTGKNSPLKQDANVYFYIENKIGIKYLRTIMDKHQDTITCIISIEGPTTFTKRDARDQQNIQFPTYRQLFNDISKHQMIPQHRLLNEHEKSIVKDKFNIQNDSQWPRLLQKDPVSMFYHFQKGDVIEIFRKGIGGQESSLYYRIVV